MHTDMLALMHQVLDGEAALDVRARLDTHVTSCVECARAWTALNAVSSLLADEPPRAAPPHLARAVSKRLARENGAAPLRWERARLAAALGVLALIPVAMLVAAGGIGTPSSGWVAYLSGLLAVVQWGAALGAVLGAFARVAWQLVGEGPIALSALFSLLALVVLARLLDTSAAPVRLG